MSGGSDTIASSRSQTLVISELCNFPHVPGNIPLDPHRSFVMLCWPTKGNRKKRMTSTQPKIAALLNEHEVAQATGISVATIRRWRLFREGPKYLKIGTAVRYKPEYVPAWMDARPSGGGR